MNPYELDLDDPSVDYLERLKRYNDWHFNRLQIVLTLRDVDKLTFRQIGERIGVSHNQARVVYNQACWKIRGRPNQNTYMRDVLNDMAKGLPLENKT